MTTIRATCLLLFILAGFCSNAQETTVNPTSATDPNVRIEKTKPARGTSTPKEGRVRFSDKRKRATNAEERKPVVYKNKKAVNVEERKPVVYKNNNRIQKRNQRYRSKTGKRRRTPLPDLD